MGNGDATPRRVERRWAPRYEFRAQLEMEWGSAVLRGSTRDVSANGVFIESPDTLWGGAGFTAGLGAGGPQPGGLFGEADWARAGNGARGGAPGPQPSER